MGVLTGQENRRGRWTKDETRRGGGRERVRVMGELTRVKANGGEGGVCACCILTWAKQARIMIIVKVRDGHDEGLRSLHSCKEYDSE